MTPDDGAKGKGQDTAEWTGVYAVASEMSRLGWRVSLTLGNMKSYDLLAVNPQTGRLVSVDVKSKWWTNREGRRKSHHWPCANLLNSKEKTAPSHYVIFVIANRVAITGHKFYVVPGSVAIDRLQKNVELGKRLGQAKMTQFRLFDSPRTNPKACHVEDYLGTWDVLNRDFSAASHS